MGENPRRSQVRLTNDTASAVNESTDEGSSPCCPDIWVGKGTSHKPSQNSAFWRPKTRGTFTVHAVTQGKAHQLPFCPSCLRKSTFDLRKVSLDTSTHLPDWHLGRCESEPGRWGRAFQVLRGQLQGPRGGGHVTSKELSVAQLERILQGSTGPVMTMAGGTGHWRQSDRLESHSDHPGVRGGDQTAEAGGGGEESLQGLLTNQMWGQPQELSRATRRTDVPLTENGHRSLSTTSTGQHRQNILYVGTQPLTPPTLHHLPTFLQRGQADNSKTASCYGVSSGQKLRMLLNILPCPGQPPCPELSSPKRKECCCWNSWTVTQAMKLRSPGLNPGNPFTSLSPSPRLSNKDPVFPGTEDVLRILLLFQCPRESKEPTDAWRRQPEGDSGHSNTEGSSEQGLNPYPELPQHIPPSPLGCLRGFLTPLGAEKVAAVMPSAGKESART
ncbi:hypothetical protein Cadr_000013366 [Camelus dromedarius]|uniref:Uncharacterized protein n=1 Tax=Camelus dromedarius TaxID=9838 RepID=A0A5N4DDR9_CAMDR|nr:hypothetical protein Cadr_000013366 [Camelus dromedarius]